MSTLPDNTLSHAFIPADNDALGNELTRLAGHINAAQYRFLKLLAALVEREAWAGAGLKSPAHWLNYYCGIDLGAAREKVRVARALASLPQIDAAFRSGALSYSKVRAMTRSATPQNETLLLQVARYSTAQHVEQLVRKYRRASRLSDVQQDRNSYERRELSYHFDDDGMLVIRARLVAEEGATFVNVLNAFVAAMNPPPSQNLSQKTFPQKRADALVAMAEQATRSVREDGLQPLVCAEKAQVIVHVERSESREDVAQIPQHSDPGCSIECAGSRVHISALTARRMSCDSTVQSMLQDFRGNVLDVGRRTRTISPALRRALMARDEGCIFPGCCESRFVDAHHVRHWCDGGRTSLDNLVLLCRHHHTLLHQEQYGIVKNMQGHFEVRSPEGEAIPRALPQQFPDVSDPVEEELSIEREHNGIALGIDADTAVTLWQGERMDYSLVVGAMMDLSEKGRCGSGAGSAGRFS
ncbi:MAG: DUF222 domain-containing protein [Gammaproteobacteria bacterium]|nr:DUF222 domain-containing protein [Gammaproteobacteria bacterium]MDP2348967.1 DUF222 domain-containing protein [Gammaproteobacteria bacterium]